MHKRYVQQDYWILCITLQQIQEGDKIMGVFRKQWTWPRGLADKVYLSMIRWNHGYDKGRVAKARVAANARYGMELPDTIIEARIHDITFTYSELKWLSGILCLEAEGYGENNQTKIFKRALEIFEEKQQSGRVVAGMALPFALAFTHDEVKYVCMLLECIGKWRKPTPSERARRSQDVAKADW
jgi:hypothetical protein